MNASPVPLSDNREAIRAALDALGAPVVGGQGIYFWVRLPPGQQDDQAVVEWLVQEHAICVVPGSSCGAPGELAAPLAD